MKIFRPIYQGVIEALDDIFNKSYYADKVIEYKFKNNKKWGKRDRQFFAESVYDVVRWWKFLAALAQIDEAGDLGEEEFKRVFVAWLYKKNIESPPWLETPHGMSKKELSDREKSYPFDIKESYPEWMVQRVEDELEARAHSVLQAMNKQASIYLRVNRLLTTKEQLIESLKMEGIEVHTVANAEDALVLPQRKNVFRTDTFKKGWFEVQDAGSQHIAPLLQVEPGMRVVDACAGAGGKSLHLASFMKNKGKIISLDIHQWKLNELKKRSRRARVDIIETRQIESSKVIKRLDKKADRLLLDVPCSGLGVLKRNPDTKWKLTQKTLDEVRDLQWDILSRYQKMVVPGGKMVFATCSILPSENQLQVQRFLKNFPQWKLEEEVTLLPDENSFDGFYAARLALV